MEGSLKIYWKKCSFRSQNKVKLGNQDTEFLSFTSSHVKLNLLIIKHTIDLHNKHYSRRGIQQNAE